MPLAQQFAQDRQGRRFADVLNDVRISFPAILAFFNDPHWGLTWIICGTVALLMGLLRGHSLARRHDSIGSLSTERCHVSIRATSSAISKGNATADAAVVQGAGLLTMRNQHGVVINLQSTQRGVKLTAGGEGITITLKNSRTRP